MCVYNRVSKFIITVIQYEISEGKQAGPPEQSSLSEIFLLAYLDMTLAVYSVLYGKKHETKDKQNLNSNVLCSVL
jgi:hypothetical protein